MTEDDRKAFEETLKYLSNLLASDSLRVKDVNQEDRGTHWEYTVLLTDWSGKREVILRSLNEKQYDQPNLPTIGQKYSLRLTEESPFGKAQCGSYNPNDPDPTLQPLKKV